MRNFLLAAVATAAIATPAIARDGSPYVGADVGLTFAAAIQVSTSTLSPDDHRAANSERSHALTTRADIDYKTGYDVDLIGGYDFGMFRLEGELGYKHAKVNDIELDEPFLFESTVRSASSLVANGDINFGGHVSVLSGMVNGMLDFGDDAGWGGFVGGGAGLAHVRLLGDSDSGICVAGDRRRSHCSQRQYRSWSEVSLLPHRD